MASTFIEYEVVTVGPEIKEMRRALNELGRRGFRLQHTRVDNAGVYTFIFWKDTGRLPEDEQTEWVDDGFVTDETAWAP